MHLFGSYTVKEFSPVSAGHLFLHSPSLFHREVQFSHPNLGGSVLFWLSFFFFFSRSVSVFLFAADAEWTCTDVTCLHVEDKKKKP